MVYISLFDYLGKILNLKGSDKKAAAVIKEMRQIQASMVYKKLAVDTCVDLITNAFLACEFVTYQNGKEYRSSMYHLLNIQPNQNESAAVFYKRLLGKLLRDNECLVVTVNSKFFIADSYDVQEYALLDNVYKDIIIGELPLKSTFEAKDVLHFKLGDAPVKHVLDSVYDDYKELLAVAKKAYGVKNSQRLIAEGDTLWSMTESAQKDRELFFGTLLKDWLKSDGSASVMPLPKGINLYEWQEKSTNNSKQGDSRDIKNFIDDIFEFVSNAYHVPIALIKGEKLELDNVVDDLIMFAVRPLVKIIEAEMNAKLYSKSDFQNRSFIKADMSKIKLVDISTLATAADKLFAAGINSINDSLRMFGRETIDEPWADLHYVTKNYEGVDAVGKDGGYNKNDKNAKDTKKA